MRLGEITTERLILRRPRLTDVEAMFAIMSNPLAMRYWSTLPHVSREATAHWLAQKIERTTAGGEDFLVEFKGQVIGDVGAGRLPDFGFIMHPDFWGRGFATEASTAFVTHVFKATGTPKLVADVDPRNGASLRVLTHLGFVETGRAQNTFKLGDEWCDSIYLALMRPADRPASQ